jgi:hypothetical protein
MERKLNFEEYMELIEDYPGCEEFHCVEFTRKVRDMLYKEENGLPADEEKEYVERVKGIADAHFYAFLERKGVNLGDFKRVYAL